MLLVGHVNENRRVDFNVNESLREAKDDMITVLNSKRSDIPAVTHVDYSSRIQTVSRGINKDFYDLLCAFRDRTGCSVLVNTSFNVRGEPIVNSLNDAYTCFMRTRIVFLVLENCILYKEDQKEWNEEKDWKNEYELD